MLIITRSTNGVGKYISQMRMPSCEREKKNVLRRSLKTASDGADVTWYGTVKKIFNEQCLSSGNT